MTEQVKAKLIERNGLATAHAIIASVAAEGDAAPCNYRDEVLVCTRILTTEVK